MQKNKICCKTANVNFVIAKQMLEKREACILKAKAPKIKPVITKLQELGIDFNVNPSFNYWECLKDNLQIVTNW